MSAGEYLVEPQFRVISDKALEVGVGQRDVGGRRVGCPFGGSAVAGVQPQLQPDGREQPGHGEDEHREEEQKRHDVAATSLFKT